MKQELTVDGLNTLTAPKTWSQPETHFYAALDTEWYSLIFKLMNTFVYSTTDFYRKKSYASALMPITCESVSSPMGLGSDSVPVKIDLFDKQTYLADSMQFQLEYLLRLHGEGVWYLMPTFRGEDPDARHLNQFFHSESEIKGDLNDVMTLVEDYLVSLASDYLEEHGEVLEKMIGDISHLRKLSLMKGNFPQITFEEACELLGNNPSFYEEVCEGVKTITSTGEKELMKHFGGIVWLTHFPAKAVPFYQAKTECGQYAKCADLLMGIGEVVGCGERHTGTKETNTALIEHEVDPSEYQWYLNMKESYPMKTSGFGMGLERFLLWLMKHDDIRDMHIISRIKGIQGAP